MTNEREKKTKQIILEVGGVDYTLEYNRNSLKVMEAKGFSIADADRKIVTSIDMLVEGALWKNYPALTQEQLTKVVDGIYDGYDVAELTKHLMEMFALAVPDFNGEGEKSKKVFKVVR